MMYRGSVPENVTPIHEAMAQMDARRTEEPDDDQQSLFEGWTNAKGTFFSLTSARGLPLGTTLAENQHVSGTWEGKVIQVKVGKSRVIYDIQVLEAEVT